MQMFYPSLNKHPVLAQKSHWAITGYVADNEKHKRFIEGSWVVKGQEYSVDIHITLLDTGSKKVILERNCHICLNTLSRLNNWSEQRQDDFFEGQINMVEDTLLLQLESRQGFRIIESLLRVFEKEYEVRGVMLKNNQHVGSWVLELVRIN